MQDTSQLVAQIPLQPTAQRYRQVLLQVLEHPFLQPIAQSSLQDRLQVS